MVRTRFAPSPTGLLHIGSARTALFNWLFARKSGGRFILRIEDTDLQRSSGMFEASIMEDLWWLGLDWDEGPDVGGGYGPYKQSGRLELYRKYAEQLVGKGLAYRCYCTRERLESVRNALLSRGLPPRYDGRCRELKAPPPDVEPVIRFKVHNDGHVRYRDGVHGDLVFDTRSFGDFIIIGSDGIASYNFAVVVDDALMEITDVIRGDDHLSNTPRQIILFESLGFKAPDFSHIPLVLGDDKTPLSKRQASASLKNLREEGYLPGAIINAIARLGWAPKGAENYLSLDELKDSFDIPALSRSASSFDPEMLKRFNKMAMEKVDAESIIRYLWPGEVVSEKVVDAVNAVKSNAWTLKDIEPLALPFIGEPLYSDEALDILKEDYSKKVVGAFRKEAEALEKIDRAAYETISARVKETTGEKGKRLFMPLRCALTGQTHGIELEAVLRLLGKEKTIERLKRFEV